MKQTLLKIMGICIIIGMLVPTTVGLNCNLDDREGVVIIMGDSYDDDGHLTFSVLNGCTVDVDNETILIRFRGSCPFIKRNQVDVDTEIFVNHLPPTQKGLYKTKHQVFNVLPIINRPLILFFSGEVVVNFNGYERNVGIMKIMSLTRMGLVRIPYP